MSMQRNERPSQFPVSYVSAHRSHACLSMQGETVCVPHAHACLQRAHHLMERAMHGENCAADFAAPVSVSLHCTPKIRFHILVGASFKMQLSPLPTGKRLSQAADHQSVRSSTCLTDQLHCVPCNRFRVSSTDFGIPPPQSMSQNRRRSLQP